MGHRKKDMMPHIYLHHTYTDDGETETEITVEYRVTALGTPGQYYGPPERCYPAEPMEIEIVSVVTKAGVPVTLSDADALRIKGRIIETHEDDGPDQERE
jgi:hypothetical protein